MDSTAPYYFKTTTDILPLIDETINELAPLYGLDDKDDAEILLNHFLWNQEKLNDQYLYGNSDERIATFQKAGVACPCVSHPAYLVEQEQQYTCEICMDTVPISETVAIKCGHRFCIACCSGHLVASISEGPRCIATPCLAYKCGVIVPRRVVTRVLASAPETEQDLRRYNTFIARHYIDNYGAKNYQYKLIYCPNPDCDRVAVCSAAAVTDNSRGICDTCTTEFCRTCGNEYHDPVSCHILRVWKARECDDSKSQEWIKLNTNECPNCKAAIEKNQGCNHMVCKKCMYNFCWLCKGTKCGHFDCKGAQQQQQNQQTVTPEQLAAAKKAHEDYMVYYNKYSLYNKTIRTAKQLYIPAQISTDLDYLPQAKSTIVAGYTLLKHSYIYAFYLSTGAIGMNRALFEYNQITLENNIKTLHDALKADPNMRRWLVATPNGVNNSTKVMSVDLLHEADSKKNIYNLTAIINNFIKSLLDYIQNDMIEHGIPVTVSTSSAMFSSDTVDQDYIDEMTNYIYESDDDLDEEEEE